MSKIGFEETRFAGTKAEIVGMAESVDALAGHEFLKGPVEDFRRVFGEKRRETRLHVAVCGAYSSGKSTLVSCLTGRNDIEIGAGITTDKPCEYECGDWTIVDTPGICAGRPDHDERSLRYMERADLLLYMIPSKGFSPEVERNFKDTIMARYAEKTMLVMGRISDVEESNLPAKRHDVAEVLGDENLLETFRFCMVDVKDFIEGGKENDEELKTASHMDEFMVRLDEFLRTKGDYGKCLALLDVVDGFIGGAETICQSQEARDAIAQRQRKAIENAMDRYRRAFRDAKERMLVFLGSERTEMLSLFPDKGKELQEKAEKLNDRLVAAADDRVFEDEQKNLFNELQVELQDIDDQIMRIDQQYSLAFNGDIGGVQGFDTDKWKGGVNAVGNALANMNKEALVKIVHFLGGKFKPWGAAKMLKCVNGVGKVLGGVAVWLGPVLDLLAEKKEEDARRKIRGNFAKIEADIQEFYGGWASTEPYQELQSIKDKLDEAEAIRRRTNAAKDAVLEELQALKTKTAACRMRLAVS